MIVINCLSFLLSQIILHFSTCKINSVGCCMKYYVANESKWRILFRQFSQLMLKLHVLCRALKHNFLSSWFFSLEIKKNDACENYCCNLSSFFEELSAHHEGKNSRNFSVSRKKQKFIIFCCSWVFFLPFFIDEIKN